MVLLLNSFREPLTWSRNYNSIPFFAGDLLKNVEAAGASFALLTKRAGQGKTNLLCDFTENFLLKKNYCVWYYNAYELRESPMEALMILRRNQKELPQEDWDTFSADVNDPIGYNELVQLFSRLPPTYRAVLEMRMINDYSGKEIAVHLGISESAVNTRISRGRILLRELAVKEGFHV